MTSIPWLEDGYVLGPLLGEGTTGQVYEARDVVLGVDVAVKIMLEEHVSSEERRARFASEASIAARVLSPYSVKVLGQALTRACAPCIVFERLEGETLATRLSREGTLSVAETAEIARQTARALARVHTLGVVHRDVKPENIFLTRDGDRLLVKLLDFGIAEVMGPNAGRDLLGTPAYMAPEVVFRTEPLDVRADLYALGVVVFECLTGRCPYLGTVGALFAALHSGARPSLLDIRPELDLELDAWVERALHPDPFWRFSTAKELSADLEAATSARRSATKRPGERREVRPPHASLDLWSPTG